MDKALAEKAVDELCRWLAEEHAKGVKGDEENGGLISGEWPNCEWVAEGESEASLAAREMAHRILEAGGCNGLSGCKLCRS